MTVQEATEGGLPGWYIEEMIEAGEVKSSPKEK